MDILREASSIEHSPQPADGCYVAVLEMSAFGAVVESERTFRGFLGDVLVEKPVGK